MIDDNSKCGVYAIYDNSSDNVYVGSSQNVLSRLNTHFYKLTKNDHVNKKLQQAFNSCNNNFSLTIYPIPDRELAYDFEQILINNFKDNDILFNNNKDARGSGYGRFVSDETRAKMSAWQIGKKHSPETIAKLKEKAIGRIPTQTAIDAARLVNIGKKHSQERLDRRPNVLSKPVIVNDVLYPSLSAAGRAFDIDSSTAHNRLNNSKKFSNWRYA